MKKRILPKNQKSEPVRREKDKTVWRYCFLMLLFGGILVVGFFFAARQHFSAISLGMKNSELRKQRDELQTEERRLKVSREMAFSHTELEKAARNIGLEKKSEPDFEITSNEPNVEPKIESKPKVEKPRSTFVNSSKEKHEIVDKPEPKKTEKTLSDVVKSAEQKVVKEKLGEKPAEKTDTKLNKKGA
jgi:hypothetical protein